MAASALRVNGAARLDLVCKRGQTFTLPILWEVPEDPDVQPIVWVPVDLTGFEVRFQVRQKPTSAADVGTLLAGGSSADDSSDDAWVEVVDAEAGQFVIHIKASKMAGVPAGYFVWDVEAAAGDTSQPIAEGDFTVGHEVTRA